MRILFSHSRKRRQYTKSKMPLAKTRGNRRPSSSSYTSTFTTVVIIALCVLCVWMLTSDSTLSPQSTNRTSKETLNQLDENVATATTTTTTDNKNNNENNNTDLQKEGPKNEDQKPADLHMDSPTEGTMGHEGKGIGSEGKQDEVHESSGNNDDGGRTDGRVEEVQVEGTTTVGGEDNTAKETKGGVGGQEGGRVIEGGYNSEGDDKGINSSGDNINESVEVKPPDRIEQKEMTQIQANGITNNPIDGRENNPGGDSNGSENTDQGGSGVLENGQNFDQHDQVKTSTFGRTEEITGKYDDQRAGETRDGSNTDQKSNLPNPDIQAQQEERNQMQPQELSKQPITFGDETNKDQPARQEGDESSSTKVNLVATTPQDPQTSSAIEEHSQKDSKEAATDSLDRETGTAASVTAQDHTAQSTAEEKPVVESNSLPNSGIPKESRESKKTWATQAANSHFENEKHKQNDTWELCNVTAGADYIPCLDNTKALKKLRTTKHYEHRERHCPEDPPTCLVPLPKGYKRPIRWPMSRDTIWFSNVPYTQLVEVKGHQNWVNVSGEKLIFPGGGTQFIKGANYYIDFIQESAPSIAWGRHTRVVLDVGCGVASFGGYLFDKDVLTMSFAPKDEHEAQIQFALERGIPAFLAVMGTQRLPFPSIVFDLVHCARCRVPWHVEGGRLLLELNRVLRPGGYFVWSATPVYQKLQEDVEIWEAMKNLTASMCWKLETVTKDTKTNKIGAAIFRKPTKNDCYDSREQGSPPMCRSEDNPNAAWYVPLQACMHRIPTGMSVRGSKWPPRWPKRLKSPPYWLNATQMGIYGKPAPEDFSADYDHWKEAVKKYYHKGLGIRWSDVRNVMDMRAVYGGFAAVLHDLKFNVWVMNVVNVNSPDTLPIIYERGLFGIYHDWCQSFSTYPRTYDLLHADHLFTQLKTRCDLAAVMAEVDRILRPRGILIVRDESKTIGEVEDLLKSLHWEVQLTSSKNQEGILSAQKTDWRPKVYTAAL